MFPRLAILFLVACGTTPTPGPTDPQSTDEPEVCTLPANLGDVAVLDLGTLDQACLNADVVFPFIADTQAELAAIEVNPPPDAPCLSSWASGVDWSTQRVVIDLPTMCGTSLRAVGMHADGSIEALFFEQGCGMGGAVVHGLAVPAGTAAVDLSICAQDTGLYP